MKASIFLLASLFSPAAVHAEDSPVSWPADVNSSGFELLDEGMSAIANKPLDPTEPTLLLGRPEYPTDVTITTTGVDCPAKFTPAKSGDFESITLIFSDFQVIRERPHLACRIGIDYKFPQGWRFWRPSFNARGFQFLNKKQDSVWVVRTRLNGGAWKDQQLLSRGPINDNFQIDGAGGEALGEKPTACGARSAHIDVEVISALFAKAPDNSPQQPVLTLDSIDTEIDWQRCP